MKIKLLAALTSVIIFGVISPVVFSNAIQSSRDKSLKASNTSANARSELPVITNEIEYAEFVRKREGTGSASSFSSARLSKVSSYSSTSKAAKQ